MSDSQAFEYNPYGLDEYQLWLLGTSAPLVAVNRGLGCRYDLPELVQASPEELARWRIHLEKSWDIRTRKDLLRVLNWLGERGGHRERFEQMQNRLRLMGLSERRAFLASQPEAERAAWVFVSDSIPELEQVGVLAWDLARYGYLCRQGLLLGLLEPLEAWYLQDGAGRFSMSYFANWAEYCLSFCFGYAHWRGPTLDVQQYVNDLFNHLADDEHSPLKQMEWVLELPPELPQPASLVADMKLVER